MLKVRNRLHCAIFGYAEVLLLEVLHPPSMIVHYGGVKNHFFHISPKRDVTLSIAADVIGFSDGIIFRRPHGIGIDPGKRFLLQVLPWFAFCSVRGYLS